MRTKKDNRPPIAQRIHKRGDCNEGLVFWGYHPDRPNGEHWVCQQEYESRKIKHRQYSKSYTARHPEARIATTRKYTQKNIAKIREKSKAHHAKNRQYYRQKSKEWRMANPEKQAALIKNWRSNNRDRYNAVRRQRYATCPNVRAKNLLRNRLRKVIGQKYATKRTLEIIGCSVEQLIAHIESQWEPGMSWDNHGPRGWHVDHIIPCNAFQLDDQEQAAKCFHYTNMRPLWWRDNLDKRNIDGTYERRTLRKRTKRGD